MKKKPRTLRNRCPRQIDLRPLLNSMREAAKAMSLVTDAWRGAGAAGGQGADDFLRENFFVGIATGPNELVMSAEAVMRIPAAVRWADNPIVSIKTSPDFVEYLKNLEPEINGAGLSGYWVDEAGEIPQPPG